MASGWNRIGFSLAPLIASEIVGIIKDDKIRHINDWLPDRKPLSFGTKKECADFFAASRCANLIEHNLLDPSSEDYNKKYDELYSYSAKANYTITKKLGMDLILEYTLIFMEYHSNVLESFNNAERYICNFNLS